jgi:hypothetical protein
VIRSGALLITAALALLVAGVVASSLELVYVSIGISILAAIALTTGVVLRRGELFGRAWPERQGGPADWPAADVTGVPPLVGGRKRTADGGRGTGDLASVPQPATAAASEARPGRRRDSGGSGPAKGGPGGARRTGDHSAGRAAGAGRPAKSRSNGREAAGGGPAGAELTDGGLGWPRGADREEAAPARRDRDRAAASWDERDAAPLEPDRKQAVSGRDRDQPAASWEDRAAAPPRPPGFRVPPFGDRPAVAPADQPGRVGEEAADGGRHDPARPAWPATAGPRAMGTGPAAKSPPAGPRDGGPEPGGGFRLAEPVAPEEQPTPVFPESPESGQDRGEPASTAGSPAHRGLFEPLVTGKPPPLEMEPEPAGDAAGLGPAERAGGAEHAGETSPAGKAGGADETSGADQASATDMGQDAGAGASSTQPGGLKPPPADGRDEEPGGPGEPGADEAEGSAAAPLDGQVTIVPGISRYHRRQCILIRFLSDGDLETMTREAAQAAGSVPCKACQPDNPASGD